MHINRRLFTATLAALFSAGLLVSCGDSSNTSSSGITQVVSFGDSLSDIGTYAPVKVMSTGVKFSTNPAPLWTEVVASAYGLPLKPASFVRFNKDAATDGDYSFNTIQALSGLSYAQGSARVSSMSISSAYCADVLAGNAATADDTNNAPSAAMLLGASTTGTSVIGYACAPSGPYAAKAGAPLKLTAVSIKDQISNYLDSHNDTFSSNQLVLIQGGANDLFVYLSSSGSTLDLDASVCGGSYVAGTDNIVTCAAKEMGVQLHRLVSKGATHIIYANLPDVGLTPKFYNTPYQTSVSNLSALYNATVTAAIADLIAANSVTVFDTKSLLAGTLSGAPLPSWLANPTSTFACLDPNGTQVEADTTSLGCASAANGGGGLIAADAATTYLFADGVHPTQLGHQLWGDAVATQARAAFP